MLLRLFCFIKDQQATGLVGHGLSYVIESLVVPSSEVFVLRWVRSGWRQAEVIVALQEVISFRSSIVDILLISGLHLFRSIVFLLFWTSVILIFRHDFNWLLLFTDYLFKLYACACTSLVGSVLALETGFHLDLFLFVNEFYILIHFVHCLLLPLLLFNDLTLILICISRLINLLLYHSVLSLEANGW